MTLDVTTPEYAAARVRNVVLLCRDKSTAELQSYLSNPMMKADLIDAAKAELAARGLT